MTNQRLGRLSSKRPETIDFLLRCGDRVKLRLPGLKDCACICTHPHDYLMSNVISLAATFRSVLMRNNLFCSISKEIFLSNSVTPCTSLLETSSCTLCATSWHQRSCSNFLSTGKQMNTFFTLYLLFMKLGWCLVFCCLSVPLCWVTVRSDSFHGFSRFEHGAVQYTEQHSTRAAHAHNTTRASCVKCCARDGETRATAPHSRHSPFIQCETVGTRAGFAFFYPHRISECSFDILMIKEKPNKRLQHYF